MRTNMRTFNWLVRITGEKNMFYDSEDRLYRCRTYCFVCNKSSGCRCFDTLEMAEKFIEDDSDILTCSYKCMLIYMLYEDNEVEETMKEMGWVWRIRWYLLKWFKYISKDNAYKVIDELDLDVDYIEGESC